MTLFGNISGGAWTLIAATQAKTLEELLETPPEVERLSLDHAFFERSVAEVKALQSKKRFIITSAQNNTPVDDAFWQSILVFARDRNAAIVVLPTKYRNPTSPAEKAKEDIWWDERLHPYLYENVLRLHKRLTVFGNVRIVATAVSPLTGMETLSQGSSAIFGHAQIQMTSVATQQSKLAKLMHTTGSCTKKNYSRTKAGFKAEFHHSQGAIVVEKSGRLFHMRAVYGDSTSSFYDIWGHYTPKGKKALKRVKGLVMGDIHARHICPVVKKATFIGKDSMVSVLKPERLFWHDSYDGYAGSHHHRRNPAIRYAKHMAGYDRVEDELQITADLVNEVTPPKCENVFVVSNHTEHLRTWLFEADIKTEPWNAEIYHQLWLDMLRTAKMTGGGVEHMDPFEGWSAGKLKHKSLWPRKGDKNNGSFEVLGCEFGLHGHRGTNGSKGSLKALAKIGIKVVIGHSHTPGIYHGGMQTGTSTPLTLEYTDGPSSWMNTHCIQYPNGKRQLIHIIHGHWHG